MNRLTEASSDPRCLLAHIRIANCYSGLANLITSEAVQDWAPKTQLAVAWALLDSKFGQDGLAFAKQHLLPACNNENLAHAHGLAEKGEFDKVSALRTEYAPKFPRVSQGSSYGNIGVCR